MTEYPIILRKNYITPSSHVKLVEKKVRFQGVVPAEFYHGETPEQSAIQELREETGFVCNIKPVPVGKYAADTGQLAIFAHCFLFKEILRAHAHSLSPSRGGPLTVLATHSRRSLSHLLINKHRLPGQHTTFIFYAGETRQRL